MTVESVDVTIRWDRFEDDDGTISYRHSISPKYVEKVEVDAIGSSSRMADGCGNSTTQNTTTTGWQLTVEGIITDSQKDTIMDNQLKGQPAKFVTDPISARFLVETVHVTQSDSLNAWVEDELGDGELAYSFQLQTKDENNVEG